MFTNYDPYQGILTKALFHISVIVMKHNGIIDTVQHHVQDRGKGKEREKKVGIGKSSQMSHQVYTHSRTCMVLYATQHLYLWDFIY